MARHNRVVTVFGSSRFTEVMKRHGIQFKWKPQPEGCGNNFRCCFVPVEAAGKAAAPTWLTLPNKLNEAIREVDMRFGKPTNTPQIRTEHSAHP